jgi:hypothetical protein
LYFFQEIGQKMKNLMEIELIANFLASKTLSDALQDKNL